MGRMQVAMTNRQKPNWNATWMRISPRYESYSDCESDSHAGSGMIVYSEYSGVMSTCGGSRLPAVNTMSSVLRPGMRARAMVNATNEARNSVSTSAGITMMSVFR